MTIAVADAAAARAGATAVDDDDTVAVASDNFAADTRSRRRKSGDGDEGHDAPCFNVGQFDCFLPILVLSVFGLDCGTGNALSPLLSVRQPKKRWVGRTH